MFGILICSYLSWACSESDTNTSQGTEENLNMMIDDSSDMQVPIMSDLAPTPVSCTSSAIQSLKSCVVQYSNRLLSCTQEGMACDTSDDVLQSSLQDIEQNITEHCQDQSIGYLSLDDLSARLQNACRSESLSLQWRSNGGPQKAVWNQASDENQACLQQAQKSAVEVISQTLEHIETCLTDDMCTAEEVDRQKEQIIQQQQMKIQQSCNSLSQLIALNTEQFIHKAVYQADCLAATVYSDPSPLTFTCGPSYAEFEATRGEWTRVMVDGSKWGTLCGDGSDYSFFVKWAPMGQPLDQVLIGLQGGGVCVFEEDCGAKLASRPGLFTAMDDEPIEVGIASDDPQVSPFAQWTKVYLPYCNQDVFAGGGAVETLGEIQLPRYGSVNLRAALRMVRDALWKMMDQEMGPGFRSDQVTALFGGWSAGAYGTIYNYHWILDDLQWPKTVAFPDGGLALDNGSPLGVYGLGLVKIPAWNTLAHLPPYCFIAECAIGPYLYEALSPRLKQVPEQQMMILTNPRDLIQQNDAYFMDEAQWINTMRRVYCETKDLPGIAYYFTSVADESVHVVTIREALWLGSVAGESMRDWLWGALASPDQVVSRAEEGDFVNQIPGVEPYPCEVAP